MLERFFQERNLCHVADSILLLLHTQDLCHCMAVCSRWRRYILDRFFELSDLGKLSKLRWHWLCFKSVAVTKLNLPKQEPQNFCLDADKLFVKYDDVVQVINLDDHKIFGCISPIPEYSLMVVPKNGSVVILDYLTVSARKRNETRHYHIQIYDKDTLTLSKVYSLHQKGNRRGRIRIFCLFRHQFQE